ncbi:hypothetical protein D3875_09035 [Deinococcus cavernae]|uniref:Uncharacterized protein n=1 Tax=Deinococcus cavernae TaxID=2320857 RepID=A0A418VCA9_9DEIO|nr:hypothetical protein D3875_09035 [Deinococcus cavernae]
MRPPARTVTSFNSTSGTVTAPSVEQVSELRALGKNTPLDSILRPAHPNSLAPLGQKALLSFVRCFDAPCGRCLVHTRVLVWHP